MSPEPDMEDKLTESENTGVPGPWPEDAGIGHATGHDGTLALTLAPRLARLIVATVLTCLCLVGFLTVLSRGLGLVPTTLSFAYMAALLLLQLLYFGPYAGATRTPFGYLALTAQACLVYLPMLEYKQAWVGMPGFLAGTMLLTLPSAVASTLFVAIVASMAVIQAGFTGTLSDVVYTTVSTIITGLVVYGLSRLANLVTEVHAGRTRLAELAVAEERLRFARDLHDLLGYSLSAITLKSELAHRLVLKNPVRAQEEFSEVLEISRQALTDVRAVARGYRELSLENESTTARSVLAAADVEARMEMNYDDLPVQVRTLLATVLREGVTNVLRHSRAERCEISVRQHRDSASIDIVNDGVSVPGISGPVSDAAGGSSEAIGGSGIQNLSVRVRKLGGELNARHLPSGRFRLHAQIPLRREEISDQQPAA
jgi:two-component system sensor histidine kinase DesK